MDKEGHTKLSKYFYICTLATVKSIRHMCMSKRNHSDINMSNYRNNLIEQLILNTTRTFLVYIGKHLWLIKI